MLFVDSSCRNDEMDVVFGDRQLDVYFGRVPWPGRPDRRVEARRELRSVEASLGEPEANPPNILSSSQAFQYLAAPPPNELDGSILSVRPPAPPLSDVLIPLILRRLPFPAGLLLDDSRVGQVQWNADEIATEFGMLIDGCIKGLIKLLLLRDTDNLEVLRLPTPFCRVSKHRITLDARIRCSLFGRNANREILPCEPVVSKAPQSPYLGHR